jgi:RNA polymerase sigma factor (sigma-70 family)
MPDEDSGLDGKVEQAFQTFAAQCGPGLAAVIRPIVLANLKKGRVRYYLSRRTSDLPLDYLYCVAGYYEQLHDYLCQLQKEKQAELWLPLFEKLQRWANRYLLRKGFSGPQIRNLSLHIDCATEAAGRLLHATFPYDTAFDPWLAILLQRAVDRHLGQLFKQTHTDHDPVTSEKLDEWWKNLPDLTTAAQQERVELLHDVLKAIDQLPSEAQKQVILLHDFRDVSYEQIAIQLKREINAVYKLHHDAIINLRKILLKK